VPLLIDQPRWPAHGRLWSHLISDSSLAELHAFADLLGLPPRSFEGDHYDVPAEHYRAVVAAGARPVSMRELVTALHASGLRRPKRKGERVLASTLTPDAGTAPPARTDLLASTLPPPVTPMQVDVLLFRASPAGRPSLLLRYEPALPAAWSLPWTAVAASDHIEDLAARAVSQQTGVQLDPATLRICGHTRTLTDEPTWRTHLTSTLADGAEATIRARWLPTDDPAPELAAAPWWPLVDWLLDRRQPRPTG
jgi:ADP-ribose pyrophosphatase YjhB (NUDIX family)